LPTPSRRTPCGARIVGDLLHCGAGGAQRCGGFLDGVDHGSDRVGEVGSRRVDCLPTLFGCFFDDFAVKRHRIRHIEGDQLGNHERAFGNLAAREPALACERLHGRSQHEIAGAAADARIQPDRCLLLGGRAA
jgi:hypothetical protein